MPKPRREEAGSLSESERQKLQRLYTKRGGASPSVGNLVKASNLSVSKVRRFLHSKPSYTKSILATRKFKRMKAFARFKNEIWCLNLAYVDRLAKDNNSVKYLLVRQDLFDRTVDAKWMKTNDSKEKFEHFGLRLQKGIVSKKIGLTREQNLLENFKNYVKLKECKFTLQWVRPRLHLLNGLDWAQYRWRHESSIAALLVFHLEAQSWRNLNYWTVHEP